jgi:hypothetical protein
MNLTQGPYPFEKFSDFLAFRLPSTECGRTNPGCLQSRIFDIPSLLATSKVLNDVKSDWLMPQYHNTWARLLFACLQASPLTFEVPFLSGELLGQEHRSFAKMWMIGGQIHMEKSPPELAEAGWRIGQILKDRPVFCKLPPREWGQFINRQNDAK